MEQPADQSPAPRWGEFPPPERQAELAQRLQAWEQESDHKGRAGPFAGFKLTGADVFWLAVSVVGKGDVASGRDILARPFVVNLSDLRLEGADLYRAQLQGAKLSQGQLQGAKLFEAQLQGASLEWTHLEGADLSWAQLQDAHLNDAQLQEARLGAAQLQGAHLSRAQLQSAQLGTAQLQGAFLFEAQLGGAYLTQSNLSGVNLRRARLDGDTRLIEPRLDDRVQIADVAWNGVPLNRVDWEQIPRLGDEAAAHHSRGAPSKRLSEHQAAARAYRQLAVALRGQGITEPADRFTYRAQIMQRKALWWQIRSGKFSKLGAWLFSGFLATLTGYGFRMWRIIAAYTLIVLAFASAYWGLSFQAPPDLSFWQAVIVSVTAFHGRVFPNPFTLNEPQIAVTALEAICGLVIEGVFIAMLTQRFFSR